MLHLIMYFIKLPPSPNIFLKSRATVFRLGLPGGVVVKKSTEEQGKPQALYTGLSAPATRTSALIGEVLQWL